MRKVTEWKCDGYDSCPYCGFCPDTIGELIDHIDKTHGTLEG